MGHAHHDHLAARCQIARRAVISRDRANSDNHRIRPANGAQGRSLVADIRLNRLDLTDIAVRAQEQGFVWTAHGAANPPALFRKLFSDIAPDKAGASENCDDGHGVSPVRSGAFIAARAPARKPI